MLVAVVGVYALQTHTLLDLVLLVAVQAAIKI